MDWHNQQYSNSMVEAMGINQPIRWFYGNDPARDSDYHTIVINGLKPHAGGFWMPLLRDVYRYKGVDYLNVLNFLFNNLFKKYPPMRYAVDYSRDPTWAELIRKKLGEEKTIEYKFTIDNKLHLMTIMRNYLLAGYTFPNVDQLIKSGFDSVKAEMVREIKTESLREQMKPTTGDKISFSDGGKHNDLLHGQALSLKAVYEYTKSHSGFGQHSTLFGFDGASATLYDETEDKEKKMRSIAKLMQKKGKGLFDSIDVKFS